MENLLPKPREMDFNASNLAATWKKWKQNMEFYLTAVMRGKSEEEKYSVFLFLIGEQGRDIFNTMEWEKKVDAEGNETDEDNITVKELFKNFEEYCLPKKNLVVERRKFFWKNQHDDETFDQYMTELKNLASTCEFGELHDGLLTYKIADGIRSEKIRDVLLRKGAEMTLVKAINICRTDEITRMQMKEMSDKEINGINKKKYWKSSKHKKQGGGSDQTAIKRDQKDESSRSNDGKKCKFCGRIHKPRECPAYGQECRKCKKKNHWASCCYTRKVHEASAEPTEDFVIEEVETSKEKKATEAFVILKINNKKVKVKLDTGAEVNVMPLCVYEQLQTEEVQMMKTATKLCGYGGTNIPVVGKISVNCEFRDIEEQSEFYIVKTDSKTVLSLQTCKSLGIIQILNEVKSLKQQDEKGDQVEHQSNRADESEIKKKVVRIAGKTGKKLKEVIVEMYPKLFNGLGRMEPEHHIKLNDEVSPKVHPPRKIPMGLREKLKKELDSMEKAGVIQKVDEPTEWVNSMVVAEKPNGDLRVCLDPRDLNKAIKREYYQLPTFEEIASRLNGAKIFTNLDANKGYWQIPLDENSIKLTTFNTPFGRYQYTRLPYGIHSAQEVFHKRVSQSFDGIQQVETDIDDILIWGQKDEDHDFQLIRCLEKAQKIGITMNINKCQFKAEELVYLGHKLTSNGVEPDEEKIRSIIGLPVPEDKKGIQQLLGLVNYVGKFIPNLSEITAPLRNLMVKNVSWQWGNKQDVAFRKIKDILVSKRCLAYYDVKKPVMIQVDA